MELKTADGYVHFLGLDTRAVHTQRRANPIQP